MEGGGIDRFTEQLRDIGVPNPRAFAYAVAGTECFGGALFALGVKPRLSGLALAGQQARRLDLSHVLASRHGRRRRLGAADAAARRRSDGRGEKGVSRRPCRGEASTEVALRHT